MFVIYTSVINLSRVFRVLVCLGIYAVFRGFGDRRLTGLEKWKPIKRVKFCFRFDHLSVCLFRTFNPVPLGSNRQTVAIPILGQAKAQLLK